MGGKCTAGVECLLSPAIDKKSGKPIGADATGKWGTPKCEFIMRLLRVVEPENGEDGCWLIACCC